MPPLAEKSTDEAEAGDGTGDGIAAEELLACDDELKLDVPVGDGNGDAITAEAVPQFMNVFVAEALHEP